MPPPGVSSPVSPPQQQPATSSSSSLKGASYLILLQIASRGTTFLLNQLILRRLSPSLLGLSTQLDLFAITILYFARESIRVAVQRETTSTQKIVNFAYVSFLLGVPLALGLGAVYVRTAPAEVPFFTESLWIYALACGVELLSEPGFVAAQQGLLFHVRARAEGLAAVARCFATVGAVVYASRVGVQAGVLPFAVGQFAFSAVILGMYVLQMGGLASRRGYSLLPRRLVPTAAAAAAAGGAGLATQGDVYRFGYFSQSLTTLTASLFLQNAFKYVLTQGDGILVAALTSLHDQGTYALASNYGGLVARMLFQPIEEITRNHFARTCAPSPAETRQQAVNTDAGRDTPAPASASAPAPAANAHLKAPASLLTTILHIYTLVSLLAITLGPTLSPLLLSLLTGPQWSTTSAPQVLATYCYYIPFLAINGVTEAFVAAVATPSDLKRQSTYMAGFFGVFAAVAYLFLGVLGWGARGLVIANCVNMGLRIIFNLEFVAGFFGERGTAFDVREVLPTVTSGAICGGYLALVGRTPVVVATSSTEIVRQLVMAAVPGGVLVVALGIAERRFIVECYRRFEAGRA